jgi:outer membrane murein-binding lipoprotein Lpp
MDERESDIEFDFFDEPETEEATDRVRLPRRPASGGGPSGPRRTVRTPQGLIPMLRLAGLIAFLILAVIVLVFLLRGCASNSKHSTYANYMQKVRAIAANSAQAGRQLNQALNATGIKETTLESNIRGFAAQESQLADQAKSITPPGPLRGEHDHLIEVLQLRASGLSRLADAFAQTATAKSADQSGRLLAAQARLLVASDVNWDFYFRDASRGVLQKVNVTGVNVPDSNVVPNPDLASSQPLAQVWRRIRGAATHSSPGGNHGSALVSVTALPDGKRLDPSAENTVTASTDLAFQVAVQDSGSFQEFDVKVTLTIARTPKAIQQTRTISIINASETKNVTFTDLGPPPYAVPTTVKVDVQPVPGERIRSNNSAEYKVIFSLG